jgi:S1-C subfamily serine protease
LFFPKSKKLKTSIKNFNKTEQIYATKMIKEALKNNPDGQLSKWKSPNNETIYGSSGPISTYGNCREFVSYVQNGYETLQIGGTACLENNKWLFEKVSSTAYSKKSPKPSSQVKKENERLQKKIARLEKEKKQKPKTKQVAKKEPQPTQEPKLSTSGSGFFISRSGHIITNHHIVNKCKKVTVGDNAQKQVDTRVIETDRENDLALLKISSLKMASVETKSLIKKLGITVVPLASDGLMRSEDVELGEDVLVSGYPYGEIFSNSIKVTKGIVSANRGLGDDTGQFQIDAAVQPGNSGGPIYDENGNIVGVVVSQLNKMKFAKATGSMPENVNFGIKASTVRQFLNASGLPTKWSKRSKRMNTRELAKIAKNQTVMVMCHR